MPTYDSDAPEFVNMNNQDNPDNRGIQCGQCNQCSQCSQFSQCNQNFQFSQCNQYNPCSPCNSASEFFDNSCSECLRITQSHDLRSAFGIVKPKSDINFECLELCVQNVRLECVHNIDCSLPLVGVDQRFGSCRLSVPITGDLDTEFSRLLVTGADEELRCYNSPTPVVHVKVQGQVILRFIQNGAPSAITHYIAIPVDILDADCGTATHPFRAFPNGVIVPNNVCNPHDPASPLKVALRKIDGSCLSVNLCCEIMPHSECIRIRGTIVEKLWKEENICIPGLRPYEIADEGPDFEITTLTILSEFDNQAIPSCSSLSCSGRENRQD